MNIQTILAQYDSMFGKSSLIEIECFLCENIRQAREMSEDAVLFTLLNEMIGLCRDTTQKEKALSYCEELLVLLEKMQLEGSVEYATALLNIANAYRAFSLLKESDELFAKVEEIYRKHLPPGDFGYANLYNNWALTYQESEKYEEAARVLKLALEIVDSYEDAVVPQATTRTNLAATLIQMGSEECYAEAVGYLKEALEIHEDLGGNDFHYGATLVALGDAYCFQKDFQKAAKAYADGMKEIEKHTGKNENYERVHRKYIYALKRTSNLNRCERFYEQFGKPMIHEKFSDYEGRIAVGMVGEGSDCFGFEDEISTDHDYGIGFCMWLTAEDYESIGKELQKEYDNLTGHEDRLKYRRGVMKISDFYNTLLGTRIDFEKEFSLDYSTLPEEQLATVINGRVFRDELGVFSKIREKLLQYYPEPIWREKLAQCVHRFSQFAQSNYPRMMARGDVLSAQICVGKAVEITMDIVYLLNRTYAPYYKWKRKGMETFLISKEILPLLEQVVSLPVQKDAWRGVRYQATTVNMKDGCVKLFEQIAEILLRALKEEKLVVGQDVFLEQYVGQILEGKEVNLIDNIIALEWKQFDKVKNEGGRASCQDDWGTFSIMRKSQYLTWPEELLESFYADLCNAEQKGWNLIMEKYARMMNDRTLEKEMPELSDERVAIQEEIIRIQVTWMEEFAEQYPKMASNARSIRSSEDTRYNTSYETYLRGEISTYSEETFVLYTRFIVSLLRENRNLAKDIMEQTAKLYGYESLENAEKRL